MGNCAACCESKDGKGEVDLYHVKNTINSLINLVRRLTCRFKLERKR